MGHEIDSRRGRSAWLVLPAIVLGVLLAYSQTMAFTWDEGFHLLAAQSIRAGRLPYLDFCFPQTPLNAWWNAAWMQILGDTWRAAHALAALDTTVAVVLAADFVGRRFPKVEWRLAGAVMVALVLGLNPLMVQYATVGQAYAFCLLLLVAAFRCAVVAVERPSPRATVAAGLLSAAAAASSLLTVAVAPVVLIWILWRTSSENRGRRFASFFAGAAIPFLPVLWLFARAPKAVFFNLIQYQLLYRRTNWEDATPHDLKVLTSWISSPNALALGLLAVYGLWFVARRSEWKLPARAEFYLCGWIAAAIGTELCATHPTFESYFVLVAPFLAIPAAAGLFALTARLPSARQWWPAAALAPLLALGLVKSLREADNALAWRDLEAVARKVDEVTPSNGTLWADEHVYFLTRRRPAEGTEFSYAEVIDLPENVAAPLHIASDESLDRRAAEGKFDTVSTCEDREVIERLNLTNLFRQSATVGQCHVFWDPTGKNR